MKLMYKRHLIKDYSLFIPELTKCKEEVRVNKYADILKIY